MSADLNKTKRGLSKPTNKSIKYLRMGIVGCILGGSIGAFIVWMLISTAKQEILIPVVATSSESSEGPAGRVMLKKGDIIDVADLDSQSVGKYGLSPYIVTDPTLLVGNYVNRDYREGEYFWSFNILKDYPKTLSEKIRYSAVPVPVSLMTSVNADIQEDDFVRVRILMGKEKDDLTQYESTDVSGKIPDSGVNLIKTKELDAVRVVGFYDGAGADITAAKRANNMNSNDPAVYQQVSPSMIVFDANPIQEALLLHAVYGGSIQLIIIPEEEQLKYKREWGLVDENDPAYSEENQESDFADDSAEIEKRQQEIEEEINATLNAKNAEVDEALSALGEDPEQSTTEESEDPNLADSLPPGEEPLSSEQVVDLE